MNTRRQVKIYVALITLALHALPSSATTEHIDSGELQSRIGQGGNLFELVAQIGDGAEGSRPEFELQGGIGQSLAAAAHEWQSNREEAFRLEYSHGVLAFSLGGVALAGELESGPVNLYVRCRAVRDKTGVTLIDLSIDGDHLGDSCWTLGPYGDEILWIDLSGLSQEFRFEGTANLAWIGDRPDTDELTFILGGTVGSAANEESSWSQVKQLY